jgi:hypothetical protein
MSPSPLGDGLLAMLVENALWSKTLSGWIGRNWMGAAVPLLRVGTLVLWSIAAAAQLGLRGVTEVKPQRVADFLPAPASAGNLVVGTLNQFIRRVSGLQPGKPDCDRGARAT